MFRIFDSLEAEAVPEPLLSDFSLIGAFQSLPLLSCAKSVSLSGLFSFLCVPWHVGVCAEDLLRRCLSAPTLAFEDGSLATELAVVHK